MPPSSITGPFSFPPNYPPPPDSSLTGKFSFPPGLPSSVATFPSSNQQIPAPDDGSAIPPVQNSQLLWNIQYLNHTTYHTRSRYTFNSGLSVVPSAGPVGTNNRVVRFQAPQMRRFVEWFCTSEDGSKPSLPDPQATNFEILVDADFSFISGDLDTNGNIRVWHAAGWYLYEMVAPRLSVDGYFANSPATDTLGFLASQYTDVNFVQGILGPSPNPIAANPSYASPETGAEGLALT